MSKKLIAVAAAAALALTGLVATPASAASITGVAITTGNTTTNPTTSHADATSAIEAATEMTTRTLDFHATGTATRNVVRFVVSTGTATTAVAVNATGGVLLSDALTNAAGDALKITDGKTSLSGAAASNSYTFYAYSTSTTAGKIVISTASSSLTYYVKAKAGPAYSLANVKFPTTVLSGAPNDTTNTNVVTWNVVDAFGNSLDTAGLGTLTVFSSTTPTVVALGYSTTTKVYSARIHGAAGTSVSMNLALAGVTDLSASGNPVPVVASFSTVSAGDLAAQVKSLTAQVAALTADYNALATKWNKKVTNKKAPKKKVALK
jgi:molybdopterin-binding protein